MKVDNVIIFCENREELIAVLEYLEEYTGVLWRSGRKPLKHKDDLFDINVLVIKGGVLTYDRSVKTYYDFINNKTIHNLTRISAVELLGIPSVSKSDLMDFLGANYDRK